MRFGLAVMNDYPAEADVAGRREQLAEQALAARAAGMGSVWLLQHYLGNMPTLQPVPLLGWLAARVPDIGLGTNMFILPLRHPVAVAEEFATLDQLSDGRIVAGFGMGYRDNEFAAFGIDPDQRKGRYEESVQLIRRLWSGERVVHQGDYFTLDGEAISLRPVQAGGPPIWVGAGAHRTGAVRAATLGDAWLVPPHVADDRLVQVAEIYRDERARLGRGIGRLAVRRELLLDHDREKAFATGVQARSALSAAYGEFNAPDTTEVYRHLSGGDAARATASRAYLFTDPETCVAELRALAALGVTDVVLRAQWYDLAHEVVLNTLDIFAREVLPELADLEAESLAGPKQ